MRYKRKAIVVRKVDDLGRLVIPKEIRRSIGVAAGTPVAMSFEDGRIILSKYNKSCCLCGSEEHVDYVVNENLICKNCAVSLREQLEDSGDAEEE